MTPLSGSKTTGPDHNTHEPIVSVLMPCYNTADTLDEALHSLTAQSLELMEIIAVDDGSEDDTADRLKDWSRRDPRVRPILLPHGGIIEALNAGLVECRASLIARMDADDRAHPDRLTKQVQFMSSHPDVAVVGCLVEGFPRGMVQEGFRIYIEWLNSLVSPSDLAREIFIESPLVHPSVMFRKTWIERVGGYQDRGWPEDYDLWLRLNNMGAKFAKIPEILLSWREHPNRHTRTDSRYSVENFLRAKAHYLSAGPLAHCDAVVVWGAGQMGRRLSKHLLREGAPLTAFVDIDPSKIGRKLRDRPVIGVEDLGALLARSKSPVVLASVGSRGAREKIRQKLNGMGLREGNDWWAVA